ncbi:recombinase family protein [Candidatus Merdisoma sp. JLR.KK011]|uniref:recombinase family protein n=1 Tax=Candidatus Merdisoma sp. JLR.KK011 TaxID=3114299 RepID=UPI002FF1DE5F
MARKSRIAGAAEAAVPEVRGIFKAGIYARLSNEASGEDTLETQVYFLERFVESRGDMMLAGTYSDFGYTGTNYERPGFLRLMEDAKRGKVDCIVVKDLSRLGRNYIETGNLIENVFSFLNIRLVAVTDGFDTGNGDGMGAMVASIKNLVNDVYSRDISRKIISAFRTKQRNGEFIGMVAPYGYLKSKENKNRFVVDGTAAPVVRRIFRLYADGVSIDKIVRILDGDGIDCPRKYRYRIGVTKSERYKDSRWGRSAVRTILTNRAYIGDMVQGKERQELCNNVPKYHTDKSEWIVAEDTHEPVVDRELFFRVQGILEERQREQTERREKSRISEHKEENYLKGYMRCGHCGKTFNLSQTMRGGKVTRVYYCRGYQTLRSAVCMNKDRVDKAEVERFVLGEIKGCIRQMLKEGISVDGDMPAERESLEAEVRKAERELKGLDVKLADLYQDAADGILDNGDYLLMRKEFLGRKEKLAQERERLLREREKCGKAGRGTAEARLRNWLSAGKLDRQMAECFVEEVRVFKGRRLEASLLGRGEILRRMEG